MQVKARDELLQQQAAAVAEQQQLQQQQQQQQPQLPDTTFYPGGAAYQDQGILSYTESYPVDPGQSQLYNDPALVSQDMFYNDQSAYQRQF